MPDPPGSAESRQLCAGLTAALPRRLGELTARAVDGDRRSAAAWGDPPVVLRCGLIAAPTPVGQLVTLDGVDWAPISDQRTVRWTTVGRRATVEVQVPRTYNSQAPLLAQLSPIITGELPTAS